ncbi:MAG TPA: hypothetical protein VMX17_03025 [Candidatus Glassbacteria bacterium]|nr:hypothetical protein [Candidatus Glassbacteria bacterium]
MKKKMNKQIPISKKDVTEYLNSLENTKKLAKTIVDRIDTVLRIIWKAFKEKNWENANWWFYCALNVKSNEEKLVNMFKEFSGEGTILFQASVRGRHITDEWNYYKEFPVEFLFMEDEKIKNKVESQIDKTNKRMEKESNEEIREKVLAKLTKEDREILGF